MYSKRVAGKIANTGSVCLVLMPYADVARPSLALGLLKSALKDSGLRCTVDYANLQFAEKLGWLMPDLPYIERLMGEWVFSSAAFPGQMDSNLDQLLRQGVIQSSFMPPEALKDPRAAEALHLLREYTAIFVDEVAHDIVSRQPSIVGCSSTFEQHCASLALLRRVKEIDSGIVTMLGGANCEGPMGWATLKSFDWIDYVVSGEADEIFRPLCERVVAQSGRPLDVSEMPSGVMGLNHVRLDWYRQGKLPVPRTVVQDINNIPVPDYSDYFNTLRSSELQSKIRPGLLVETSRGCWWGQKSHCTFCGLNGEGMNFRAKTAQNALLEFDSLASQSGVNGMMVVDNILEMDYFKTLLPELAERGAPYRLFYETKANLTREQVRLLKKAGVMWIQPGIEAFHDELLKLMGKGNSAAMNIQLLRHTREFGIFTTWLLLFGFPGEDESWHEEVADWLPLLFHLQPPKCIGRVLYDRFSPYHQNPQKYGLDLKPAPSYSSIYPLEQSTLEDLAYFFTDTNTDLTVPLPRGVRALTTKVVEWSALHKRSLKPVLTMQQDNDAVDFFDTRPCAKSRRTRIKGLDAVVYAACEPAVSIHGVMKRLATDGSWSSIGEQEVENAINQLKQYGFLLEVHGKLIPLAVPGDCPAICEQEDFPGGHINKLEKFSPETLEAYYQKVSSLVGEGRRKNPVVA